MQGACRQVPGQISKSVGISITGVFNPESKQVELSEIFGQPFGAGHAVPNFKRVAEWYVLHFFDDVFLVDCSGRANTAMFCVKESFRLLGFILNPHESQLRIQLLYLE